MSCLPSSTATPWLKSDVMAQWIQDEWIPRHPDQEWVILKEDIDVLNLHVLSRFDRTLELPGGYTFAGDTPLDDTIIPRLYSYSWNGTLADRTSAYAYHFASTTGSAPVDTLVMASYINEYGETAIVACVPVDFLATWADFTLTMSRLRHETPEVFIIGGQARSFKPTVEWDDIILPPTLKDDILRDVTGFYDKGTAIYQRLNLKPFRKLLLAGVPGTGKTMLCSALAKWALARGYLVIYVSSANQHGPNFIKIEHALSIAANSDRPALILLEELDVYIQQPESKSVVLNVLDGAEGRTNPHGTLLVATTNYPEAIDDRVLKRPGRLDRIFIVPAIESDDEAERMLSLYLSDFWREEHRVVAAQLVGYTGAFAREVALYALTQMAYDDLYELPLDLLQDSFTRLAAQIEERDDFVTQQSDNGWSPAPGGWTPHPRPAPNISE